MKKFKKALSAITALMAAIVSVAIVVPASAAAADDAIVVSSGKAYIGNGAAGIAIAASYDENGKLTYVKTKTVDEGCVARFNVEIGDRIMYWSATGNARPLAGAVTVTEDNIKEVVSNENVYEKAVQNVLYEALGKSKGANMTELQKAVALHDWLVVNCQYDLSYGKKHLNPYDKYGAVVDGYCVCDGYTKAYADLLGRVGIKAERVVGLKGTERHAWNCITIGGKKYYVDVTADDPVEDVPGRVGRSYFLVSDSVLKLNNYNSFTSRNCTDTTYEKCDMFMGFHMAFMWNDDIQKFYYIDMDEVKTTADFTEELIPTSDENGARPSSYAVTDNGKYLSFLRPGFNTNECTVYLYCFETGEYYSYAIKGIDGIILGRVRQNRNNIEVVMDTYDKDNFNFLNHSYVKAFIPIPKVINKRYVTFDENYSGGKVTSCAYINNYWTNGDGIFYEPKRLGLTFGGWYTEKDGGTEVKNFDEITGDNVTLYAHWWGRWSMKKKPTLTETGTAIRSLDGYPDVTDEIIIPELTDTSVWTRHVFKEADEFNEGKEMYRTDAYGDVWYVQITTPKLVLMENKIGYADGKVWIAVLKDGKYYVVFKTADSEGRMGNPDVPAGKRVVVNYPRTFTPSGKVTATLYDSNDNALCSVEYEV